MITDQTPIFRSVKTAVRRIVNEAMERSSFIDPISEYYGIYPEHDHPFDYSEYAFRVVRVCQQAGVTTQAFLNFLQGGAEKLGNMPAYDMNLDAYLLHILCGEFGIRFDESRVDVPDTTAQEIMAASCVEQYAHRLGAVLVTVVGRDLSAVIREYKRHGAAFNFVKRAREEFGEDAVALVQTLNSRFWNYGGKGWKQVQY